MSDSVSVLSDHPPVTDWVEDFDHTDPRWTENPFPIWDELRAECPVVHTKRFLGCYLPCAADHLRPAGTQARQAIAAAAVHARRHEEA